MRLLRFTDTKNNSTLEVFKGSQGQIHFGMITNRVDGSEELAENLALSNKEVLMLIEDLTLMIK